MPPIGIKYRGTKEYHLVYCALIEAARAGSTIDYPTVAQIMGIRHYGNNMARQVGQMAGEISEDEVDHGRPMLSAVLVRKGTKKPSQGFFDFARQLGRLQGETEEDEQSFLEAEQAAVYRVWGEQSG